MNERFVQKYGKFCLLFVFLASAAVSGCNWNDAGQPAFEQMTVFENASDTAIHLYINTKLVSEVEGKRSYFHTAEPGSHTWSAITKYERTTLAGGSFRPGDYVRIPQ